MQIVRYEPAILGLGTESSSKLQPLDFSPNIINRFYNYLGDLVKRPGMVQLGNTVVSSDGISGSAVFNNLHEYINISGENTLFASGSMHGFQGIFPRDFGMVQRYDVSSNTWSGINNDLTGKFWANNSKTYSVQMNNKMFFCNGINRNAIILDPSSPVTANYGMKTIFSSVIKGVTGGATNSIILADNNVSNWKTQTNVAQYDLVNVGTDYTGEGGFGYVGVVTSIGTSSLDITNIGTSANGSGNRPSNLASNTPYQIVDLVELNVIPKPGTIGGLYDNVGVALASTSANAVAISADSLLSQIRRWDIIYNTTRNAVGIISTVSSTLALRNPISGQTTGDSLLLFKDAMPIASYAHVHYGRLHLIDSRDPTKIRVSGPNDLEDFSTFSKTLTSITIDYGARQPKGDILLTMSTFQRYLVVGGKAALFVTDGTNPIADVTADVIDLDPVGLFPQGVFSPQALQSIGNEMLYVGYDGLRSFLAAFDSKNTTTNNKSEQIKTELINVLQTQVSAPDQVQLVHYPRRNWVMMKIGDVIYNYNYTPMYSNGKVNNVGTFTKFTGLLAQQDAFLVSRNGDLITADTLGKIYTFDVSGIFKDNGANIPTTYVSPWHTLQESESNTDVIVKDGRYIRPVFETSAAIKYNISVVGDYDQLATDSVVVTAAVSGITNPKMPLRWRGKQAQFTITTDTSVGADIINSYTLYGNIFGRK